MTVNKYPDSSYTDSNKTRRGEYMPFTNERITERLLRIRCPGNVFAYLAVGNEQALLVDTGLGLGSLKEYVRSLSDLPLTVVATHGHLDHVGGAGEFPFVFVPEKDRQLALNSTGKDARANYLNGQGESVSYEDLIGELSEEQVRTYDPESVFDLGGYHVKMLPMYGHTQGSHCALFVEDRTVLFGDACNSAAFMQLNESTTIEEYRDNLKEFKEKYSDLYDQVLYSHPHNFGGKEILDEMIGLCEEVMDPSFKGIPAGNIVVANCLFAKATNDGMTRNDGKCANMVYRKEKVRKE